MLYAKVLVAALAALSAAGIGSLTLDPLSPASFGAQDVWLDRDNGEPLKFIGTGDSVVATNDCGGTYWLEFIPSSEEIPLVKLKVLPGEELLHEFEFRLDRIRVVTGHTADHEPPDPDTACGRDCLPVGTPIHTEIGPLPVEALGPNDQLLREAGTNSTGAQASRRLAETLIEVSIGAESVRTTLGHEFMGADGNWIAAADLTAGHRIALGATRTAGPSIGTVETVRRIDLPQPVPVYDVRLPGGGEVLIGDSGFVTRAKPIEFAQPGPELNVLAR